MHGHILVVDDEVEIVELLDTYLVSQGFQVSTAGDARAARDVLKVEHIDLVLLDVGLPGEDGFALARYLREHSNAAIIMVTGRGETVDRVVGLEVGADDYVTKPFDLRELLARIRTVLGRLRPPQVKQANGAPSHVLSFSGWRLDTERRSLTSPHNENVALTTAEYDLLMLLLKHPNRVLSRGQLMDLLHGREAGPFDRSIDIQIGRLRRKIEREPANPEMLKTIRGAGYIFESQIKYE